MDPGWVTLTIALIAAFVGALAKWYFDRQIALQRNTFEFHRELHSKEMFDARSDAWEFIKENPHLRFDDIRAGTTHAEKVRNVWRVMIFFHRVAAAWKRRFIARDLVFELFGELLIWWYVVAFKGRLTSADWQASESIKQLYEALRKEAEHDPHLKDVWERWHQAAHDDAAAPGIAGTSDRSR